MGFQEAINYYNEITDKDESTLALNKSYYAKEINRIGFSKILAVIFYEGIENTFHKFIWLSDIPDSEILELFKLICEKGLFHTNFSSTCMWYLNYSDEIDWIEFIEDLNLTCSSSLVDDVVDYLKCFSIFV